MPRENPSCFLRRTALVRFLLFSRQQIFSAFATNSRLKHTSSQRTSGTERPHSTQCVLPLPPCSLQDERSDLYLFSYLPCLSHLAQIYRLIPEEITTVSILRSVRLFLGLKINPSSDHGVEHPHFHSHTQLPTFRSPPSALRTNPTAQLRPR